MQQRHDDFTETPYSPAIRTKLGEALREQHNLMEPVPEGLVASLGQLDADVRDRETAEARLYAAIDECVAAMVNAPDRKPREPGGA